MIWKHTKKLHWTCTDVDGVTMNVQKDSEGMWLFTATGSISSQSKHSHPLDAMHQCDAIIVQKELSNEQEKIKERASSATKTQDCQVESSL